MRDGGRVRDRESASRSERREWGERGRESREESESGGVRGERGSERVGKTKPKGNLRREKE